MKRLVVAALLVLGGCVSSQAPVGPSLTPVTHTDFSHDTLALTWQPGFCASGGGCMASQPHSHLIGLHGLWASEPHALEAQNVPVRQWWMKGCDIYDHDDTPPKLQPATENALASVVPHLKHPLHVHEYTKHARCFGYDADQFFVTSIQLRDRFESSAYGQWLAQHSGFQVKKDDLLAMFVQLTGVREDRALQFQCEPDHDGKVVLTQLWFTLDPQKLSTFPANGSYRSSPQVQDNCPATFMMPGWPLSGAQAAVTDQRP